MHLKKGQLETLATLVIVSLIFGSVGYFVWDIFLRSPIVEILQITNCEYKLARNGETYKTLFINVQARITKALDADDHGAFVIVERVYDGDKTIQKGGSSYLNTATTEPQNLTIIVNDINLTSEVIGVDFHWVIWKYYYFQDDKKLGEGNIHIDTIDVDFAHPMVKTVSLNITFERVVINEPWNTGDIYLFIDEEETYSYTLPEFTVTYADDVDLPQAFTLKNTGTSSLYAALVPREAPEGIEFKMYVVHADYSEQGFGPLGEQKYVRVHYNGGTVTFYLRIRVTAPLEFDTYYIKLDLVIAYFLSTIQEAVGG